MMYLNTIPSFAEKAQPAARLLSFLRVNSTQMAFSVVGRALVWCLLHNEFVHKHTDIQHAYTSLHLTTSWRPMFVVSVEEMLRGCISYTIHRMMMAILRNKQNHWLRSIRNLIPNVNVLETLNPKKEMKCTTGHVTQENIEYVGWTLNCAVSIYFVRSF